MTDPIRIPLSNGAMAIIYPPKSIGMNCYGVTLRSHLSQTGWDVKTLAEALAIVAEYEKGNA